MGALFQLSLRQVATRRRLLLLFILAALPIGLATLVSVFGEDETTNEEFIDTLLDGLLIGTVMPLVSMVLATSAFGNEIEDRTLSYLVLKPISRFHIVAAKVSAAVAVAAPFVVVSGVLGTLIGTSAVGAQLIELDNAFVGIITVAVALLAGVVGYATVFTWAGLVSSRALAYGLVYVLIWEGVIASLLGGVRFLSLRGYTLGLLHGLDDTSFAALSGRAIQFPAAIIGILAISIGFVWLTTRRLERMDVP